ncbi:MAG TPA: hypothetical protein DCL15_20440, partial [Chloroflexi bacterium]|nr:hypothetical protein [Chloroflexota bacterium]
PTRFVGRVRLCIRDSLYRESLRVKEAGGDSGEVAVTQSSLAALLSTRGQYDEAERLYRAGLVTVQKIRDLQGVAVFQLGLAALALRRGPASGGAAAA